MAGLEGRLGGLVADVRNLADSLKLLAEQVRDDHDQLNPLPARVEEIRKQLNDRLDEVLGVANDAKAYAENEIKKLRQTLEEGVNKRGERWFHIVMAGVGVAASLLTGYLTMKFGLSGGGSSASHGH